MALLLIALLSFCAPLTLLHAGGKTENDDKIRFIELGSDQGIYDAEIKDGDLVTLVTKFSFGGDTTLDGIKKEHDSSINKINLAEVDSITIIDPLHDSIRYPNQEFCLVRITTINRNSETMLMPRNLLICAESAESKIKKSWALRTLKNIKILQHPTAYTRSEKKVTYKSY